jgi:hypothetical protein
VESLLSRLHTCCKSAGHAVGTQNYSSSGTSDYVTGGAVADFYLQTGTAIVGKHFFISNGNGISPVFTKTDAQVDALFKSGNLTGRLKLPYIIHYLDWEWQQDVLTRTAIYVLTCTAIYVLTCTAIDAEYLREHCFCCRAMSWGLWLVRLWQMLPPLPTMTMVCLFEHA